MQVSGWLETENGAEMFDYEGADIRAIAKQLKADFPEDAGETDMEATDQDGEDVTQRLFTSLAKL